MRRSDNKIVRNLDVLIVVIILINFVLFMFTRIDYITFMIILGVGVVYTWVLRKYVLI